MDNSTVLTQDTTVTAQYTAKTYTVTIYPNGASGSNKTYSVTHGSSFNVPSCPFSRSNYSFTGYKTSSSSGTSYSAGNRITVTSNVRLYCQWKILVRDVIVAHKVKKDIYTVENHTTTVAAGSSVEIPYISLLNPSHTGTIYHTPLDSSGEPVGKLIIRNTNGSVNRYTVSYNNSIKNLNRTSTIVL